MMDIFEDLNEENFTLFAIRHYDNPQCTSTEEFYEDIRRFRYLKRLLKRYHNGFNIIDDVSAEQTISMWINDEEIEANVDGSYDVQKSHSDHYYKLKQ